MRIVLQRVKSATVRVDGQITGQIGRGILILLGIHRTDTPEKADLLAQKCAELRIFSDGDQKMNLPLTEVGGEALVVSQFTLYGDCRKGRRPNFTEAAPAELAKELYERFIAACRSRLNVVQTGIFAARMEVELCNDGPVTLILDE